MRLLNPSRSLFGAALLLGASLTSAAMPHTATAGDPPVRLPESPAARSFAGVGAETEPQDLTEFLTLNAWMSQEDVRPAQVWEAWGAWLQAAASTDARDPAHAAGLCWIAARQNRWEDAWRHHASLGGFPAWQAAVTPWLLPGAPITVLAGSGGLAQPIPNGLLLRPALPPRSGNVPANRVEHRTAEIFGLTIGEAVCDLVFEVEPSGMTLEIFHRSGGSGLLLVDLPKPPGATVFVDYIDWDRQDLKGASMQILIEPREDEYTLYRRYKLHRNLFPASPPPGQLPAGLSRSGLTFEVAEGGDLEEVRALASAITQLIEVPVQVVSKSAPDKSKIEGEQEKSRGTIVHVEPGPAGALKCAQVASALEAHLLGAQD